MTVIITAIASVGLAALFLQFKRNVRFIDFINFLVLGGTMTLLYIESRAEDVGILMSLLGIVAANYALAQIKLLRKDYLRALLPLISFIVFIVLLQGKTAMISGDEALVVNKFMVGGVILMVLSYEIASAKLIVLKKLFGEMDEQGLLKSLQLLFSGIAIFLGLFQSGPVGLIVLSAAFLSASFYRDSEESKSLGIPLIGLSLLPYLLSLSEDTMVNLMSGEVLEGVFFGTFGVYFLTKLWYAEKRNSAAILLGYLIVLGLAFGLLYLHAIYANMGGMDAYIGLIVGFAITHALIGRGYVGASLFSFLLIGGLVLPSLLVNEEQAEFEAQITTEVVDENGEVVEPDAIPLGEIAGNYTLIEDSSRVSFTLGENGETKGAFKKVTGVVNITEDPSTSVFEITMKMDDFTTFNGMRDKSLMSDDYFSADKYPTMSFKGKELTDKGDNVWEIQGTFTMLGVSKDIPVTVKRIDIEGKKVLVGAGEIDRTLFGMTPSATEGNIVSFEYQVELK